MVKRLIICLLACISLCMVFSSQVTHPASAQTPPEDPGLPGNYDTDSQIYGTDTYDYWTVPATHKPVEIKGHVTWPKDLSSGPFPLVIILHGMHIACYQTSSQQAAMQWPCPQGFTPVWSYDGYRYFEQALASHGYIVASISADGINVADALSKLPDPIHMLARAQLIQHHLGLWYKWSHYGGFPDLYQSNLFIGSIDWSRIGLMGHSRGGEGVVRDFNYNNEPGQFEIGSPYSIKAVFPLAPTDKYHWTTNNVPVGVLLPYCDGDVYDLQGAEYFDKSRYASPDEGPDLGPRHSFLVMGADHNYFNTVWSGETFDNHPYSGDDWGGIGFLQFYPNGANDGYCGLTVPGNSRLSPSQQRNDLIAYGGAFFRSYLGGEYTFQSILTGDYRQPPSTTGDIHVSFHPAGTAGSRLVVNSLTDSTKFTTNDLGGAVTSSGLSVYQGCGTPPIGSPTSCLQSPLNAYGPPNEPHVFSLYQLFSAWNTTASWQNSFPEKDVSTFGTFQFRTAVNFADGRNQPGANQDFTVQLSDGAGASSNQVAVSSQSSALYYPPGERRLQEHPVPHLDLNTVRIPIARFTGVGRTRITAVKFNYNQRASGGLVFSDLMFANGLSFPSLNVTWSNTVNCTANGNNLTKTIGNGGIYDTGGSSRQEITTGPGYVQITANATNTRYAFGLGNTDTNVSTADIDFAMELYLGGLHALVHGVDQGIIGTYQANDVLKVAVLFDDTLGQYVVRWYENNLALYTVHSSDTPIVWPLQLDSSIMSYQETISNAVIAAQVLYNPRPDTLPYLPVNWSNTFNVSVTGTTIEKIVGNSGWWDAGAVSLQEIRSGATGYVQVVADVTNTRRAFGLGNTDSSTDISDIDFALEMEETGHLHVYVRGVYKGDFGNYSAGDTLRVAIENDPHANPPRNVVRWYRNDIPLYSDSTSTIPYPLQLDASIMSVTLPYTSITSAGIYSTNVSNPQPTNEPCTNVTWSNTINSTANGNSITKNYGNGGIFDAGGVSRQEISSSPGTGYVQITVDAANTRRAFGLGNTDSNTNISDIDFALDMDWDGGLTVYVRGQPIGFVGHYAVGDNLRIAVEYDAIRAHNVVRWYRNSTVLYTDDISTITYPLQLDSALMATYPVAARLTNAVICSTNLYNPQPPTEPCTNVVWTNPSWNVQVNGNSITKNTGNGGIYDAGAVSTRSLAQGSSGYAQVTVDAINKTRAFGLGNNDSGWGLNDIDYALEMVDREMVDGGALNVWIRGASVNNFGTYSVNDILKVAVEHDARLGDVVRFYRNDTLLYTYIDAAIPYPLQLDTSLRSLNSTIFNAMICGANLIE